ncbi:glucosamine-6-phosphate deaminase [Spiroplasma floricola]|uniref:Glucosamine-6-phosphate deaminase n=1 Tax=Spiroplasma floricola 23-6 TaxID=1336749 RepID=A0A2K8SDW0_9MOLU|nr:glucosamine-6-phosphate deaminase [Spiroplasma floricola]AUB31646.1 glucosamine-6-phosphate deaminase [Spiroplasma floricola 23-6]
MKIFKTKNYEEMSFKALELFLEIINNNQNKERINIAITGGKSPLLFYKELIKNLDKIKNLSKIHFYNFDEVPYKSNLSTGITIEDLEKIFFVPGKIKQENIHRMSLLNWKEHIKQLEIDGDLDLVLLGIRTDGHFCGNLSGVTKFGDRTRIITLKDLEQNTSIPKPNENLFHDEFVTMGPREIMKARNIIMIANGENKAEVIDQIINGPVVEKVPSSLLTLHPHFNLIIDQDANKMAKA